MDFKVLESLGAQAVPLMIAKMQQSPNEAYPLATAVAHITHKEFTDAARPAGKVDLRTEASLYIAWWQTGRTDVRAQFEKFYADWKAAKNVGETVMSTDETVYDNVTKQVTVRKNSLTPLGAAYQGMISLGIDVLPLIIEKVRTGDNDLLPLFSESDKRQGPFHRQNRETRHVAPRLVGEK